MTKVSDLYNSLGSSSGRAPYAVAAALPSDGLQTRMNVHRRAQGESSRALNDWWAKPRQLGHHVGDATNLGPRQGLAVALRSRAWPSPRSDEEELATGAPVLPVPDWALIRRMMAARRTAVRMDWSSCCSCRLGCSSPGRRSCPPASGSRKPAPCRRRW